MVKPAAQKSGFLAKKQNGLVRAVTKMVLVGRNISNFVEQTQ